MLSALLLSSLLARPSSPLCKRLDCPEKDNTKPKIHKDAQVEARGIVPRRRRQVWHQQEVGCISCHNGDQRLDKIDYAWF
jgi:hypothetical protein